MRTFARIGAAVGVPLVVVAALAALPLQADAAAPAVPATFAFTGGGWGHGVGMSQDGAFGMASEGASATKILEHYYTGTTVGAYRDDQEISVNVAYRVSTVKLRTEALTAGGGGISLAVGSRTVTGKAGDVFTFTVSGTQVEVAKNGTKVGTTPAVTVRWAGTRYPSATAEATKATALNLIGSAGSLDTSGHRYRYGYMRVVARAASGVTRLDAVNVLRLQDEYLLGIGEVPSSWPAAALQAQVVAARSYALVKYSQGFKSGCQCDVDSGHGPYYDQNFVGYSKETSAYGGAWRAAVLATVRSSTTALTVLYKGKPAEAFYFSSSGGRTQNVKDVWGSDVPYLKSVDDHWSAEKKYNPTFATWGPYVRTQKQVAAAFGLPNVAKVVLAARYVSDALKYATATSSTGATATLGVDTFVARLGLTSNWVRTVTASPVPKQTVGTTPAKSGTAAILAFPLATAKGVPLRYYGYPAAHPTLAKGRVVDGTGTSAAAKQANTEVKRLQGWLIRLGYLHGTADGQFGPLTSAATIAFERHEKLTPDGLVGGGSTNTSGTWRALQVAVAKL